MVRVAMEGFKPLTLSILLEERVGGNDELHFNTIGFSPTFLMFWLYTSIAYTALVLWFLSVRRDLFCFIPPPPIK